MDQSAWQHLWPLISAKVSWTAAICREARSSLWILSSSSDAKCVFGSMAKPSPSATHGNSYFKFSGLSRGKVDKLITPRHLQALERLLHSQHVFAHQFTSQGIQHFLWAWQRSLSPSNIFRPCRRAYERCMRRIYGTLKNKNSRSKCTCLVKAWLWHASWEMHSRTLRVYAVLICAASCTRSQTTQLKSSSTSKAFPKVLLVFPQTFCQLYGEDTTHGTWWRCFAALRCSNASRVWSSQLRWEAPTSWLSWERNMPRSRLRKSGLVCQFGKQDTKNGIHWITSDTWQWHGIFH